MSRKDQNTSRPTVSDELTLDQLDTVAGGAAAAPLQNATDPLLNALSGGTGGTSTAAPAVDHVAQVTAAAAGAQLIQGTTDAAHAVASVEAYGLAHATPVVTGLTDLLGSSNHDQGVAAALMQTLHTGDAEKNLASLVQSGAMQPEQALNALLKATDALAHMPDTDKPVSDGLFEMSVAHLHKAAVAGGNTELQGYIETFHGFDLRSGRVEIAADFAAHEVVKNTLTIDQAITQTIAAATEQGLPKDVALTALLIDTHGHATVAAQLDAYINATPSAADARTTLVTDAITALDKHTLAPAQIVETIRESIDALAHYAPTKIFGNADTHFAEVISTLNTAGSANHDDLRTYLKQNCDLELAVGDVFATAKLDFALNRQSMDNILADLRNHAANNGLPVDIAYCAMLAHFPAAAGTIDGGGSVQYTNGAGATTGNMAAPINPAAANYVEALAQHLGTSNWTVATSFVRDMQDSMSRAADGRGSFSVDKAHALIEMAVDTLARYAPTKVEGTPQLHAAELLYQLTWGGPNNIGPTLNTELRQKYEYEMRLGEIVNAAQWGVSYSGNVSNQMADTQAWTDRDSIPRVYGLIAAIGDYTVANATILAQKLSDGISNGSLEQDVVSLVKNNKITAEQALTSMTESLDVLARFNKIPLNMPPDVARAYVFDKIVDLATAQGVTGLVTLLKANFSDDLKVGDQVQAYLTGHAGTVGAAAEWAGFVANSHMNLVISNSLATGDMSIKAIIDAERLTGPQAEQLLFTCASNGKVALPIVIAELEALRTAANPPVAVTDMITHLGTAIRANTLNDDVAVLLIAGLAGNSAAAAAAAHTTLDALIGSGDLKPQQILEDTANAFKSHTLSDAQGMTALAMLAGSANVDLRNSAVNVIGILIQAGHADAATAIAAIHNTASSLLSPAQAVTTLLSVAQFSGPAGQTAVAAEFAKMAGVDVVAAIHNGVMTHLLAGDAALHVLAELASAKPALQAAVITETASLVKASQVTGDAALGVLAGIAGIAPAMQTAVNAEIVTMVRAGQLTADHVIAALTTLATGNLAMQTSVCAEITALVTAGLSTAAHAVEVLAKLGAGATDATQKVIGGEIEALVAAGKITAPVAAQTLCGLVATGSPALRAFVGEELASLVSHKLFNELGVLNVLRSACPGGQPNAAFWTAFTAMAGEGTAALRTACATFAAPFLQNNGVVAIMSSIDAAVTSGAITAHQALTTLGCLANTLNIDVRTYTNPIGTQISNEFAAIVHRTGISAADAMLDIIHATGKPALMLMTSLAHNENELLAGIGGALAKYATEAKQTPTQIFNMLTEQAPYMSGYGTILMTRPEQLLAISIGLAAEATGDLQKTAQDTVNRFLTNGQSGLPNVGSNPFAYTGATQGLTNALAIVVDAGMHGEAKVHDAVMVALGQLVQNGYYNYGQKISTGEILGAISTAAGKTADGLKFVGEAITQYIQHGANAQPVLDFITGKTGTDYWGNGGKLNFAPADALNLLVQAANGASAATRDLIAAEILSTNGLLASLSSNAAGTSAAVQTFLSSHLSDGLAESIIAKQVATGAVSAGNAIATLTGIVDAFMKTHPTADRTALVAVSMAHLDIAVHAATTAAQSIKVVVGAVDGGGYEYAPKGVPAGLTDLQKILNTTANLQQVLTGLGMLQISQSTTAGLNDVVNMAHQATIDYTKADAPKTQEQARASASSASAFFANGFDLMAANWKTAGILKNEIIAHPDNYKSWVDLGANMVSANLASQFISGGQSTGDGYYFKMVTAGSTLLAAAFESDAVVQALGKDQALALSAPCRILSLGCNALCNMFTGMVQIGGDSAVGASVGLFETFSDISHGRNANESAQKFGNNLLQLVSGIQAGDISSGNLQAAVWDNNVYMQTAKDQLTKSAASIANVGQQLGGALSNIGGAISDTFRDFGRIVNISSY